jgi:hypothetical protein
MPDLNRIHPNHQRRSRQSRDERIRDALTKSPLRISEDHGPEALWLRATKGPLEPGPSPLEQGCLPSPSNSHLEPTKPAGKDNPEY